MLDRQMRIKFDIADGNLRPRFLNGLELPGWQNGPSMADTLKAMSESGWRLCCHIADQEYAFEPIVANKPTEPNPLFELIEYIPHPHRQR